MPSHRVTKQYPIIHLGPDRIQQRKGYFAWRPNGTNDWLFKVTLDGKGRFGIPNGEIIVSNGDLVLLRPNTPHDYGVESTLNFWDIAWAHFRPRPGWLSWFDWNEIAPGLLHMKVTSPSVRRAIQRRMLQVVALAKSSRLYREDFAMNALEEVFLLCAEYNPNNKKPDLDARIENVINHIREHLAQNLNREQLAVVSGLSVSRFSRLFHEQVGMTPMEFLEIERLDRARQLLEVSPATISEIAYEVGFENPFYFSRRFKLRTGFSPREHRKQLG